MPNDLASDFFHLFLDEQVVIAHMHFFSTPDLGFTAILLEPIQGTGSDGLYHQVTRDVSAIYFPGEFHTLESDFKGISLFFYFFVFGCGDRI